MHWKKIAKIFNSNNLPAQKYEVLIAELCKSKRNDKICNCKILCTLDLNKISYSFSYQQYCPIKLAPGCIVDPEAEPLLHCFPETVFLRST